MASNVEVKITADVVDLQTKFAVARAEASQLQSTVNKLAKEIATAGSEATPQMTSALQSASAAMLKAKNEAASLNAQLKEGSATSRIATAGIATLSQGLAGLGLGALGVAAVVAAIKQLGEAVEQNAVHIAHQSEVLQLSITSYQALTQAAIDNGVATTDVDTSLMRFSRNIAEATVGTGSAVKVLNDYNISAFAQKEAILQQISAIALHATSQERDRIATALFARSGAEMIPLFKDWSMGVDNLTEKYRGMGRIMDPDVAEQARHADEQLQGAWQHLEVAAAGPVAHMTTALANLVTNITNLKQQGTISLLFKATFEPGFLEHLFDPAKQGGEGFKPKPVAPPPPPSQSDYLNILTQMNPKLVERKELEEKISTIEKEMAEHKLTDPKVIEAANHDLADFRKQLDSLNRDPGAKAAARDRLKELHEWETEAKRINTELAAEARSDDAREVESAKLKFQEKMALLDEEFKQHKITAQQKYDATVEALNEEHAAEQQALQGELNDTVKSLNDDVAARRAAGRKATEDEMAEDATRMQRIHELQNEILLGEEKLNADVAAAHRKLTDDLIADDRRRKQSWQDVISEIESAENSFISDIFAGNVSLVTSLERIGLKFVESEIENLVKLLTEHEMVNAGILASDQATTNAGLLARLFGLENINAAEVSSEATRTAAAASGNAARTAIDASGDATRTAIEHRGLIERILGIGTVTTAETTSQTVRTAATAAGTAARTATEVAGAETSAAIQASTQATEITKDAAKAAAGAYSALAGIPIIGPIIAPIAAAAAFAAVEAFGSFDKGTNFVPQDMVAKIHAGERIIPAADNSKLISAISSTHEVQASHTIHFTYAPTINAPPQMTLKDQLNTQGSDMLTWLYARVRDGSFRIQY